MTSVTASQGASSGYSTRRALSVNSASILACECPSPFVAGFAALVGTVDTGFTCAASPRFVTRVTVFGVDARHYRGKGDQENISYAR